MLRKMLPLLVVGILVLSGLGAVAGTEVEKEIFKTETITFSKPVIREKEDYVSIELAEATAYSWEKDKPMLPKTTKVYTFPFGTYINNVEVTFSDLTEKEISKPIEPSPEVYMLSQVVSANTEETKAILTYSDLDIYPTERYSYSVNSGIKDGVNVVFLTVPVYPDQYIPNENKIVHAQKATIDITYTLPENPVTFGDVYDLLILTPSQFKSALQNLVDYKNSLNPPVRTILKTLNDVPNLPNSDDQEDIKYYIRDARETWGIDYVLLVGAGLEDSEIFPVRQAWIRSQGIEDYFPSDLYYADFYDGAGGFPDWDEDNDGKYAEYSRDLPSMDVIPDVYLARIPCNNVGEVNTIVSKIIYYKDHNYMTGKIFQVGGDTFTPGDGDNSGVLEGEYANEKVLDELPGYSTTRYWASTGNLLKSEIAKGFKKYVDFADFSGHGSAASWATHAPLDKSVWLPPIEGLSPYTGWLFVDYDLFMVNNNKKYPVVFLNACSNNKFSDYDMCLGYKTIVKSGGGGIVSYAASGIGYGAHGTHEVERAMGWMEVKSFKHLIAEKSFGQVWADCVSGYYTTFDGDFDIVDYKTMLEFCMLGDPTLAAVNGDDPRIRPVPVFNEVLEKLMDLFPRLARIFGLILAYLS